MLSGHMVNGAIACLLLWSFLIVPAEADGTSLYDQVHWEQKAYNCGIDTTAFVELYYGGKISLSVLAQQLGATDEWDAPVDLLHIKDTLASSGLNVEAFARANLADMLKQVRSADDQIAIIHLNGDTPEESGHFIMVVHAKGGELILDDIGVRCQLTNLDDLSAYYGDEISGLYLTVRKGGVSHLVYPLDGRDISANIDSIQSNEAQIIATLWLSNPTDHRMKLLGAKGSCSCFETALLEKGEKDIPPHETREMKVVFDRSKFGIGRIRRLVLLKFSGDKEEQTMVTIYGNLQPSQALPKLVYYPEDLNFGIRQSLSDIQPQQIILRVPAGDKIGPPNYPSSALKVLMVKPSSASSQPDALGREVYTINVNVLPSSAHELREKIIIPTNDKAVGDIVIPVFAEVRK